MRKILERAKAEKADLIGLSGLIHPRRSTDGTWRARWSAGLQDAAPHRWGDHPRTHNAVKIAPHYSEPVVHVLDASRAVPVTTSLLSEDGKPAFVERHRSDYQSLRKAHAAPRQELLPLDAARARRTPIEWRAADLPEPAFTGVRVLDNFPLATLREFIDWTPFFHTWELKGVYPASSSTRSTASRAPDLRGSDTLLES